MINDELYCKKQHTCMDNMVPSYKPLYKTTKSLFRQTKIKLMRLKIVLNY